MIPFRVYVRADAFVFRRIFPCRFSELGRFGKCSADVGTNRRVHYIPVKACISYLLFIFPEGRPPDYGFFNRNASCSLFLHNAWNKPCSCRTVLGTDFVIFKFCSFVSDKLYHWNFCVLVCKTDGVRRAVYVFTSICSGAFLPLNLFPYSFQKLLFYLPLQFIAYVPVRVFIGQYELAGITMSIPQIVFLQAVMVAVMFLVNRALWYMGIKHFTGVGA